MRLIASIVLLACLVGCSKHDLRRDEVFAQLGQKKETDSADVARILKLKPQLPKPFTMAVYFEHPSPDSRYGTADTIWNWTDAEKEAVLANLESLKKRGLVKNVLMVSRSIVADNTLPEIRLAAARYGADAVLVVKGAKDTQEYNNGWAYSYIALLPLFFVPGNEARSLFVASATLWDVRNEYLYLSAEGEAESGQTRPAPFVDKTKLVTEAKTRAFAEMNQSLAGLVNGLSAAR